MLGTESHQVLPRRGRKTFVLDNVYGRGHAGQIEVYTPGWVKRLPWGWAAMKKDNLRTIRFGWSAISSQKLGAGFCLWRRRGGARRAQGIRLDLLVDILSGVLSGAGNTTLLYPPKPPRETPFPANVGAFLRRR